MNRDRYALEPIPLPPTFPDVASHVMADETLHRRLAAIVQRMKQHQITQLIVYADKEHGSNFEYLAGFIPRFEEALLVVNQQGELAYIMGNENLKLVPFARNPGRCLHAPLFSLPNLGDYPLRADKETLFRLADIFRQVQPHFVLTHSVNDPYNYDHPLAAHLTQEARIIAQAEGYRPGETIIGAPPVYSFEPHQPEQCNWKPDVLLDISAVWDKKYAAIQCMAGQEHLWEYYTRVALQRGVQAKRNVGIGSSKVISHAEGYQSLLPRVTEDLS